MIQPHIQVDGLRELQADIRRQQGKLPQSLGVAHKNVGAFVVARLTPPPNPHTVGEGLGAQVRPSATKREVLLRVGYSARPTKRGSEGGVLAQWGRTPVQPFGVGRPYIVKTVADNQEAIEQMFLDEYVKALGPAFFKAE